MFINVPAREDPIGSLTNSRVLNPAGTLFIVGSNPAAAGIPQPQESRTPRVAAVSLAETIGTATNGRTACRSARTACLNLADRDWSMSTDESVPASTGFTIREITPQGADTVADADAQEPVDHPPFIQIRTGSPVLVSLIDVFRMIYPGVNVHV